MADLTKLTDAQLLALSQSGSPSIPPPTQPVQSQPLAPVQGSNSFGLPLAAPNYNADLGHLSDADLMAAAANVDPHMSTAEDMGRSLVTGLEKGVGGIVGSAGDLRDLGGATVNFTARQVAHAFGQDPGKPVMDAKAGSVRDAMNPALLALRMAPNTAQVLAPQQSQFHTPQTMPGRYSERVGEFAPAAAFGGEGLVGRAAAAILPGMASQGAEDLAPENLKPAASVLGALLGGGGAGALQRVQRAPQAAFGAAAADVTPEQLRLAQQLRVSAEKQGLSLTVPEAVQQVTGNGTGLGRLQRVVESTKQGQALTAPYFANRPSQVQGAVSRFADTIAPPTDQPGMVGARANTAATGALDKARQLVNGLAQPDYEALIGQQMDPAQYAELASNPSYAGALKNLRGDREVGASVAHLPDHNLAVVNEVQKRLGTLGDQAAGTPLAPGDNHLAALRFQAAKLADALGRDASEGAYGGEYGRARDTVSLMSAQYVDPLKAGPLGQISKSADVGQQTSALYPSAPTEGAPAETGQAVRVLGNTAPGVAEDLTRQHLVNALNRAMTNLQGGQNQYAGAKYAVSVAGNPEQEAALHAGVSALPDGAARSQELSDLVEALRATGKRQQPGSMTAFNESDLKDLHIAPFAQAVGRIADPLEWGKGIGDILNRANYRRNVSSLAEMLMAPPEETAAILDRAQRSAKPNAHPAAAAVLLSKPAAQRR